MTGDDDSMVVVVCPRKVQLRAYVGAIRKLRKLESRQQLEVINSVFAQLARPEIGFKDPKTDKS
jgi:hypothetical protein